MNYLRRPLDVGGFTLIEMIVIMTIIGVLAVFAVGRFPDQDAFEARGYYDELVAATRYAQRYAVASGCGVQIAVNASDYALTLETPCAGGTAVQQPGGGDFSGTAPAGVSVTTGTGNYLYNAYGDLGSGANSTVTVTGGGGTLMFTVHGSSGFVDTP